MKRAFEFTGKVLEIGETGDIIPSTAIEPVFSHGNYAN